MSARNPDPQFVIEFTGSNDRHFDLIHQNERVDGNFMLIPKIRIFSVVYQHFRICGKSKLIDVDPLTPSPTGQL